MGLRLFYPQTLEQEEWDPLLRYRNQPSSCKPMRIQGEPNYVVKTHVNDQGFRGKALQQNPGFRIIIIGDSFVFGHGVSDEETFCSLFEANLKTRWSDIEVINAGVKGYSPDQYYLLLKYRLESLKPNMIILTFYGGNDVYDIGLLSHEALHPLSPSPPSSYFRMKRWLASRSHLVSFLFSSIMNIPSLQDLFVKLGVFPNPEYRPFFARSVNEYIASEEKVRRILTEIKKETTKLKIPLLLLYAPSKEEISDETYNEMLLKFGKSSISRNAPRNLVSSVVETIKTPFLDLTPSFNEKADYYFKVDRHWNAKGHALAAKVLTDFFFDLSDYPSSPFPSDL